MVPELSESFEVGSALLSSLSAAYFFAYALAQIPVGMLLDRYGTRILLTLACLAIAISSIGFAYTRSLMFANYCRIFIGLGSAFAFVGCLKLAATWFPAHKFAFVVGLTNLLGVVGAIIGGNPIAYAVAHFGWRMVMLMSGVIGLFITVLLWSIIRDSPSKKSIANSKPKTKLMHNLLEVINNKQTWLIAIFAGCLVAPIVTYTELWGVSYLVDIYGLDRPFAAHVTTLTFIGIAMGGPTIGWLSDFFRKRIIFMIVGVLGALASICLILFVPRLSIFSIYILHIILGFFTSSMLLCFTLNAEATAAKIRATTVAFTNCIIMLTGAGFQMLVGLLLDSYKNYTTSFIPLICCYIIAIICIIFIKEPPCKFHEE